MKDFFVSYNKADRTWAEWVAWELEEAGYTTTIQAWDFRPGGNFVLDMQRAATEARRTIMVLSDEYLTAAYTQPEWAAAFKQDPTGIKGTLLPVRVQPCKPAGLLGPLVYIDLVDLTEEAARETLLDGIRFERMKPAIRPGFPGSGQRSVPNAPVFPGLGGYVPPRVPLQRPEPAPYFTNREKALAWLMKALQPGQVVTVCGPGGMGKSALAAKAVWELAPGDEPPADFPDGVVFHNFYQKPQADLALEQIARTFGEEELRPSVEAAARRALAGRRALLLLDGAEEADNLAAVLAVRDRCGVLVTSRRQGDGDGERERLEPLETGEAVALLRAWGKAQAADEAAAARICELVGGLPLAVRLAGKYMAETGQTAGEYLAWLESTPLEALHQGKRHLESVPVLLGRSLDQVSEPARRVLGVAGLLAPTPFSPDAAAAGLGAEAGTVRRWLGELVKYGLVKRQGERYEVTHALIHTYAREQTPPETGTAARLAAYLAALAEAESEQGAAGYRRLDPERGHMLRVLAACLAGEQWEAGLGLAGAIDGYLDIQGYWLERVTALEGGLQAARQLNQRQAEGALLGNLGLAYSALGQVPRAIDYTEQALVISREIGDRRGEGADLGNLGNAYSALGQVPRAIDYTEQALVISREIGDRRGEGAALGNLGNAYSALGQVPRAIDYYEQALVIAREIGDRRGEAFRSWNLGLLYEDGDPARAVSLMSICVEYEEQFGHPDAATDAIRVAEIKARLTK